MICTVIIKVINNKKVTLTLPITYSPYIKATVGCLGKIPAIGAAVPSCLCALQTDGMLTSGQDVSLSDF